MLNWLVEEKSIASLCSINRSGMMASSRAATFDTTRPGDVYHCRAESSLGRAALCTRVKTLLYCASKLGCDVCPLKRQCCPKEPSRKIPRDIHEHARDVARSFGGTEGFEQSRRECNKIKMGLASSLPANVIEDIAKQALNVSILLFSGPGT